MLISPSLQGIQEKEEEQIELITQIGLYKYLNSKHRIVILFGSKTSIVPLQFSFPKYRK